MQFKGTCEFGFLSMGPFEALWHKHNRWVNFFLAWIVDQQRNALIKLLVWNSIISKEEVST
jgi:hypothetical protein